MVLAFDGVRIGEGKDRRDGGGHALDFDKRDKG